jgi:hypothetical protein
MAMIERRVDDSKEPDYKKLLPLPQNLWVEGSGKN